MNLFDSFLRFIRRILDTIFARRISNLPLIFVKTNTGATVPVGLDPKWEVRDVKEFVAPKLGTTPEEVSHITFPPGKLFFAAPICLRVGIRA